MKKFIIKISSLSILFITVNIFIIFAVPIDHNAYLYEYNHKVRLLETTSQPRMIFIGGSNLAFSNDSKMIGDSLHYNIVNLGLHAGIGIRYPIEDCLQYIKQGDVVIFQFEYDNFFNGGYGNDETFLPFMLSVNWRNAGTLNYLQWKKIISGIPQESMVNIKRLVKYPILKSFDSPEYSTDIQYTASGFNGCGDEVGHLNCSSEKYTQKKKEQKNINNDFIDWLKNIIKQYEQAGATIIMMPPACIKSEFQTTYQNDIEEVLKDISHPYITKPSSRAFNDSCTFDTGYHLNRNGCYQNSKSIIQCLDYIKR